MNRIIAISLAALTLAGCQDTTGLQNMERAPPSPLFSMAGGTETRITTDPSPYRGAPDISVDRIVWDDFRDGSSDIHMYDLATNTETRITRHPGNQDHPAIYENRIVWDDERSYDIYMYNVVEGTETRITEAPANQFGPDISGTRIVWEDSRNGNSDIYMYDLLSGVETPIATDPAGLPFDAVQTKPAISRDRIVWQDHRKAVGRVYMYDLDTGIETEITTHSSFGGSPDISGDRIVMVDGRNGNYDIYMYDVAMGTETPISTNPARQNNPAISGTRIVWDDFRNGNSDIYMYDVVTGTETQITTDPGNQYYPAISGNRIVWLDYRNGTADIYMYELTLEPQVLTVDIDIKPGRDHKTIYPKSRRAIAVAVLGDGMFDVRDIDRTTLAFGPNAAAPVHGDLGHLEDVNGDDIEDLVSHYRQVATGLSPGDTESCVSGQLQGGMPFQGCRAVHVNQPRPGRTDLRRPAQPRS